MAAHDAVSPPRYDVVGVHVVCEVSPYVPVPVVAVQSVHVDPLASSPPTFIPVQMPTVSPNTAVASELVSGPENSVHQFLATTGPDASLARTTASGEKGAPPPNARGVLYEVGASDASATNMKHAE